MQYLPWFIRHEIIDYLVQYRREFCLVNKEWFNYAAGQFMTLRGGMLRKDNQPSNCFVLAEKLKIKSFSKLDIEFLKRCHKIKQIDFKLTSDSSKIPLSLIELLRNSPLSVACLRTDFSDIPLELQIVLNELGNQLKYLHLVLAYNSDFFDFSEVSFSNLVVFESNVHTDFFIFSRICQSMPNLEILKLVVKNVKIHPTSKGFLVFNKLKSLYIKSRKTIFFVGETQINDLFQFLFPALKLFCLKVDSNMIDMTKISVSMPTLKTLNMELLSIKAISSKFPIHPLLHLKELSLKFRRVDEDSFGFYLNNLPELRDLTIHHDFIFFDSQKEFSKLRTLECLDLEKLTVSNLRRHLPSLSKLVIDCTCLGDEILDVIQLCDRVLDLVLLNLDEKIVIDRFLPGPFITTQIKLQGIKFVNSDFVNWLGSNFQLTHLILDYENYTNLHIDIEKFSSLKHFHLNHPSSVSCKTYINRYLSTSSSSHDSSSSYDSNSDSSSFQSFNEITLREHVLRFHRDEIDTESYSVTETDNFSSESNSSDESAARNDNNIADSNIDSFESDLSSTGTSSESASSSSGNSSDSDSYTTKSDNHTTKIEVISLLESDDDITEIRSSSFGSSN